MSNEQSQAEAMVLWIERKVLELNARLDPILYKRLPRLEQHGAQQTIAYSQIISQLQQGNQATINATSYAAGGGPFSGATLSARNNSTNTTYTSTTDSNGNASLQVPAPGNYQISVTAGGYTSFNANQAGTPISLTAGQVVNYNSLTFPTNATLTIHDPVYGNSTATWEPTYAGGNCWGAKNGTIVYQFANATGNVFVVGAGANSSPNSFWEQNSIAYSPLHASFSAAPGDTVAAMYYPATPPTLTISQP